jgi:hypothetical protein
MSEAPAPFWGNILKSNSNGTYFGLENVNRDERGYVDFKKMIGLDGFASSTSFPIPQTQRFQALNSCRAESRTTTVRSSFTVISSTDFITGSTWKPFTPPVVDSQGNK